MDNELLNIENNIFGIIKVIVAVIGFISILLKLIDYFSDKQLKQNLKTDLEILALVSSLDKEENQKIKDRIESEIGYIYDKENYTSGGFGTFIVNLIITIGFSFWTLSLFKNSIGFNPWTILTMFIAGSGITGLFGHDKKRKTKGEFFRIEFHDRDNFIYGAIFGIIALISFIALVLIYQSFTFWLIVAGVFMIIGFLAVIKNIKFKKQRKQKGKTESNNR